MAVEMKMTGKEKQALAFFFAVNDNFIRQSDVMEKRLKAQGGTAWRDWKLCIVLLKKLSSVLIDSLTYDECVWQQRLLQHAKVGIDMPGPIKKPDYVIIDVRDIAEITAMAGKNMCPMCMKEGKEIKRCKLRDCLLHVAPPADGESTSGLCEYVEVDWSNVRG